jgi:hypothetical protein
MKMNKLIDLTGKRFGKLVVIEKVNKPTNLIGHNTYWLCKCDCGREKIILGASLRNNKTLSCGCKGLSYGEHSSNQLLYTYKKGAEKRNIVFELTKKQFLELTQGICFYCGKSPESIIIGKRANGAYIYNGIDRIDSSKGYTVENVVSCCGRCNKAKLTYNQEDFFEWIKTVHSNLSNKGLI